MKAELREVKHELGITRMERDILKGSTTMKCQQIQKLAEEFPVRRLCATLAVKESSGNTLICREAQSLYHAPHCNEN